MWESFHSTPLGTVGNRVCGGVVHVLLLFVFSCFNFFLLPLQKLMLLETPLRAEFGAQQRLIVNEVPTHIEPSTNLCNYH